MNRELEETKQNASRENAKVIERLKQEYQETVEECVKKHQNEIKSLKEALKLEKEAWMNSYKKDQATYISYLESEIRNQCKRERDKDIELTIEKLKLKQHQTRSSEYNLDYGGVL
jgi:5-azacytidine-induced protein 1